jgi:hypothetical protein
VAGTIIADVIQSDQSYPSSINIASPVIISNTFSISSSRATLGTTLSNWGSGGTMEFTGQSLGSIHNTSGYPNFSMSRNAVFNPSVNFWTYKATGNTALYQQETETHNFYGAASGSAGGTISWSQLLSFERGKTLALEGATTKTGTGITFPATQNASADANTLDDYEEGTWTPVVTPSGGSLTSYTASGQYTKVGKVVNAQGFVLINTAGTASGQLNLTMPFSIANFGSGGSGQFMGVVRESESTGNVFFICGLNNSVNALMQNSTNGGVTWTNSYKYSFTLTYQAA